jgi:hypothetical protein
VVTRTIVKPVQQWESEWQKKHCPHCRSSRVKRNGQSRHGRQRWLCYRCHRTFGWRNVSNKRTRQKVWFKRWLVEGYSIRQLALQNGHSGSTIRRVVEYWLLHPPCDKSNLSSSRYLIFDGTFLEQRKGIFSVMDANRFSILYGEHDVSEGPSDLNRFCARLAERHLSPKSATIDGNPHLMKVLRSYWPQIIIQRCLVHIQRQGLMWCRRYPKRTDAKHLRKLFLRVMSIHTEDQRDRFLTMFYAWEQRYGSRIAASPEKGWVFSDLKRARSMVLAALPDMFHYLKDPHIPKSTNALEGYYSRLKDKYRQHRGLTKRNRHPYFIWYLNLCRR